MNRKGFTPIIVVAIIVLLAVVVVAGYVSVEKVSPTPPDTGLTQCPADAKPCPDGSSVGRTGSKCEFAACPEAPSGTVVGGDKDAHGCIGSAGYSWCEAKQKCLKVTEEVCEAPLSTAEQSDCGAGARRVAVPTTTLFQTKITELVPYRLSSADGTACMNLVTTSTLLSPTGKWSVAIERDVHHVFYEALFYDFTDVDGPVIGDIAGNVFLVFTNNETGEKKKFSFVSIAPPNVAADIISTAAGQYFIISDILKWSSDGIGLWGSWRIWWAGDDMGMPIGGTLFRINTIDWNIERFSYAPGGIDPLQLNADRSLVVGYEISPSSVDGPWPTKPFTVTSTIVLYNLVTNASSALAAYQFVEDCHDSVIWCPSDQKYEIKPQWADSSTVFWKDPHTHTTTTWSYFK